MREAEWQEGLLMYDEGYTPARDHNFADCLEHFIWTVSKSNEAYRDNRDALLRLQKALADAEAQHAVRFLNG